MKRDDLKKPYDLSKGGEWKSFSLRMPTDVGDRLSNHCEAYGRVKAWVIIRAIEEWLDRDDKKGEETT